MKTKDKEEVLKHIDKIKQGVKDELKEIEQNNAKLLDGFTQKERVLILYRMVAEVNQKVKRLDKANLALFWLIVFVNVELLLVSIFGR